MVRQRDILRLNKELDAWSLVITSELSSQKQQALKQHARWQEKLDDISQRFGAQLQAERERFQRIQQEYREFLTRAVSNHWAEISFNPSEPADSYSRLWDQVYEHLSTLVRRAQDDLRGAYERAARLYGGDLENLPEADRQTMQEGLAEMQRHLSASIEQTAGWASALSREQVF